MVVVWCGADQAEVDSEKFTLAHVGAWEEDIEDGEARKAGKVFENHLKT